jgi:endoglucanase
MASQATFDAYAAAGFKSVRIPVIYVIINIHNTAWLIPDNAHKADADARLRSFWTQIADYFNDYDEHLLFAGTNEIHVPNVYTAPTAENCAVQSGFNQIFVDAVRATGGNNASRELIVQHFNTDIGYGLDVCHQDTLPTDSASDRLMMEIHYYSPFAFTNYNGNLDTWQWGAIATDPSAVNPCCNEAYVRQQLDRMKAAYVDKGVPVIMGEYGVGPKLSGPGMGIETYTNYWNGYVTHAAVTRGIVPIFWDTGNSQAQGAKIRFNRTTGEIDAAWLSAIMNGMTTDPQPASSVGVNGS